jgi:hypothetical protein
MPLTEEERQFRNFLFDLPLMFKGVAESGCTLLTSKPFPLINLEKN